MAKFRPGQSGNPNGRPKGSLNKTTIAAQELLDGEAVAITRKCIDGALDGNPVALRLVMERILPPRKMLDLKVWQSWSDVPDEFKEQILDELRARYARLTGGKSLSFPVSSENPD